MNNLLNRILSHLLPDKLPLKPSSTRTISGTELMAIIRKRFPDEGKIYLSDKEYKLCHVDDIRKFCAQDDTNRQKYQAESFDCDDFAYRLMGQFSIPDWGDLAFGICWTEKHSLNCFIDEDKMLWFLEPQSDVIESNLASWQGSHLRFIIM